MAKRIGILMAIVLAVLGLWYVYSYGTVTPKGQPALTVLSADNFTTLQKQFNDSRDSVRVIVLLSPT